MELHDSPAKLTEYVQVILLRLLSAASCGGSPIALVSLISRTVTRSRTTGMRSASSMRGLRVAELGVRPHPESRANCEWLRGGWKRSYISSILSAKREHHDPNKLETRSEADGHGAT